MYNTAEDYTLSWLESSLTQPTEARDMAMIVYCHADFWQHAEGKASPGTYGQDLSTSGFGGKTLDETTHVSFRTHKGLSQLFLAESHPSVVIYTVEARD